VKLIYFLSNRLSKTTSFSTPRCVCGKVHLTPKISKTVRDNGLKFFLLFSGRFEVVGGIVSPVSDGYGKQGLVPAKHRISMAKLALQSSNWVTVDEWESQQPDWTETVVTMRYKTHLLYAFTVSFPLRFAVNRPLPQLKLLCGADFLSSFKIPGLWLDDHVEELVQRFGLVCVSRGSLQPERAVHESDTLFRHRRNVFLVREWVRNETSATEIRRALRRDQSVKYLIPDYVIEYIRQHELYTEDSERRNEGTALRPLIKQFNRATHIFYSLKRNTHQ
uniref:Nicotinamide-nucleotide adenylyltransferase n=1 Tax=Poecilia mexicana TaxID=48701 RepID=A0A3B3XKB9_9TELE